jgi:hypothetical protein
MKPSLKPEVITYAEFEANRDAYESSVPAKLHALEDIRLRHIPELLEQRNKHGDVYLERTDVSALVEWKLCVIPMIDLTLEHGDETKLI